MNTDRQTNINFWTNQAGEAIYEMGQIWIAEGCDEMDAYAVDSSEVVEMLQNKGCPADLIPAVLVNLGF